MKHLPLISLLFSICLLISFGITLLMGWNFHIVVTDSMRPTMEKGSVAITKPVSQAKEEELVGEIILFQHQQVHQNVMHRVERTDLNEEGSFSFVTKGDANRVEDHLTIKLEDIDGVYVAHIPVIGYVAFLIQKYWLIIVGAFLITMLYTYQKKRRDT
ncbi:signal peptidase I [Bacillus sp. CGMCC 1.16541]|uniref:signal peptidase I n=1 Tax=Bacillus sp. CGMCC 1.16541 TaxID=2185143 RepID=UPI000D733A44|nr:signal peptidase I [Bacillus sp. CGMCC 1.16541]